MIRLLGAPAHVDTTAQLGSAYPFMAESGLGGRGIYIGQDVYGGAFVFDPWELYEAGVITGPNVTLMGQIGRGKSALAKSILFRGLVFGRRAWCIDPKGELLPLCRELGIEPVRLRPGGDLRLNPLDPMGGRGLDREDLRQHQLEVLLAIVRSALGRELTQEESTACQLGLEEAVRDADEPTLSWVADAMLEPAQETAQRARTSASALAERSREAALALRRMCVGDLRGMFDGPTSARIDLWAPIVALDVNAVWGTPALGIVMVCAGAYLRQALAAQGGRHKTWIVYDEAWAVLQDLWMARQAQASAKLSRHWGIANMFILHRPSDLAAAGPAHSQQVRLAQGLLADAEVRVLLALARDDLEEARRLFGLSDTEAAMLPDLPRGRALWKVGSRSFLVDHRMSAVEKRLTDTDQAMRTVSREFRDSEGSAGGNSGVDRE
jgi:type IV secretory pathway VirB4 component